MAAVFYLVGQPLVRMVISSTGGRDDKAQVFELGGRSRPAKKRWYRLREELVARDQATVRIAEGLTATRAGRALYANSR